MSRLPARNSLKEYLPGGAGQLVSLGNTARFFAALLVLTLVARGTSGATIPKVETAAPHAATLTDTFEATGAVAVQAGAPFQLPAGLLVTEVCVEEGAQVAAGAPLARVDTEQLALAVQLAQAELHQMQVSYTQGMAPAEADDYNVRQNQERLQEAYADTEKVWARGEADVQEAQDALDAARSALAALQASPPQPPAAPTPDAAPAQTPDSAETPEAQESPAPAAAETPAPPTPEESPLPAADPTPAPSPTPDPWQVYEQAKADFDARVAAAQSEVKAAEAALKAAQESAEAANEAVLDMAAGIERERNSAIHSYEKALEEAQKTAAASQAAAGVTAAGIAAKKAELERLLALQQSGGVCVAPYSGTVTALALAAGSPTPAVGGLLADLDTGATLTFTLPKAQAERARVGMAVTVRQGSRSFDTTLHTLGVPAQDGSVQATVLLPAEGGWQAGSATARLTAELGSYAACVPAAAVHADSGGGFVYKVEEQDTVLGRQNVLVRIPVTVEQSGGGVAAVSGAVSASDAVVVSADRPLSAGARVRLE